MSFHFMMNQISSKYQRQFKGYAKIYKIKIVDSKDLLAQLEA